MKKLFAVLLSFTILAFTLPTVFAETQSAVSSNQTNITENDIALGDVSPMAETSGITSNTIYNIKNVGSGKYLNVHYGTDANGTNIYQWTKDGSTEQKFRVVYSSATDTYKLYAMCSSSGTNRVVNVARGSASLAHGQNVNLWTAVDTTAQNFKIVALGQNQFRISTASNRNMYLAAYGNSNGTSGGTTATSAGNVYLSSYVGEMYQHWMFEPVGTYTPPAPYGHLDAVTTQSIGGWAWRSDIPNDPINVHIYVKKGNTTKLFKSVTAGNYRADLASAGYGNGYHGFTLNMDWSTYDPGQYTITAFGMDNNTNPPLQGVPAYFTVAQSTGQIDSITSSGITGWVWKSAAPNKAISAHIYIKRSNGETLATYNILADDYRSDLYSSGYGNGYHGFSQSIDWESFPREQLTVQVYAVDGSSVNPCIYNQTVDFRKSIYILAPRTHIRDENGDITPYYVRHNSWINSTVTQNCMDIGTSDVVVWTEFAPSNAMYAINNSSLCIICTHGSATRVEGIFNNESIYFNTDYLNNYYDNYFTTTKCVTLMACSTAEGRGYHDDDYDPSQDDGTSYYNFVNTLERKGIETVVGFDSKIYTTSDYSTELLIPNTPYCVWGEEYVKSLSEGYTVEEAVENALARTIEVVPPEHISSYGEAYGFENYYIAGNKDNIIKH